MITRRKKICDYKVVVFDLDGTLYYQKMLRMTMAKRLMDYYLHHPFEVKDLLIVKKFREVRDMWDDIIVSKRDDVEKSLNAGERLDDASLDDIQYRYVAKKMHSTREHVESVIDKWIYKNPLDAVKASKDHFAAMLVEQLKALGVMTVIWSDYPVKDKLEALEISFDAEYYANQERLNEMKPSPKGLYLIMHDYEVDYYDVLMIGDRDLKDGEAARKADIDYIVLGPTREEREPVYSVLMSEIFDEAMKRASTLL